MKLLILSDTHGLLRPEVIEYADQADAILHAGDVHTPEIFGRLEAKAPLYIVRGNNDTGWAAEIPLSLQFELCGIKFYMIHNRNYIHDDLSAANVVIFGHTHQYFCAQIGGKLWLNPGGCGRRRFNYPLTITLMTIADGQYEVQRIDITPKI